MKDKKEKKLESLETRYKKFQDGETKEPVVNASVKLLLEDGMVSAILSKEIEDRDGEVVIISGVFVNDDKQVPLLDSHRMNDNVVENVIGKVVGIRKAEVDGISILKGQLEFAPTPKGQIAKILVEGKFVDSVSIGFGVKEYDPQTRFINKSELYEVSLVSVPANPGAKIDTGKSLKEQQDEVSEIEKSLGHYKTIKAPFKDFVKTFLSDEFCGLIEYEKKGDLLIDVNNIYDVVYSKFKNSDLETPTEDVENLQEEPTQAPQETPDMEAIFNAIDKHVRQTASKYIDSL